MRRTEIEKAASDYSKLHAIGSVERNLIYQDFCYGAEWADNNPQDVPLFVIDLIHQRSIAFDESRNQRIKAEIAIEALKQCRIYSECYDELIYYIDEALERLKD
jgi:hypothetical protein